MITISLCMIVKNEEHTLARCLSCVDKIADEIIIVDTGSTDRTKEIASRFTTSIYDFPWQDDFSAARNFAFSKATCTYWLWLDADDILTEENQQKLLAFKETATPNFDVAMLRYHTAFDAEGKPTFSYFRERIIRRVPTNPWEGAVHEVITPFGNVIQLDIAVSHKKDRPSDSNRNLNIYKALAQRGHAFTPRETYYYARELYYHGHFQQAEEQFNLFLADESGWVENKIETCQLLAYCLYNLGQSSEALTALFASFAFDAPRAEVCCDIGKHFFDRGQYRLSLYWYHQAYDTPWDEGNTGFQLPDCYDYIPALQLAVCYYRLGNLEKAISFNEIAGKAKSHSEAYEKNRVFFQGLLP